MNVLVYSGPGTTSDSVKHCLETLRLILSPYYAVFSIEPKSLLDQPWASKTSVLVFPGGADLPMCRLFNGDGNREIEKFVKRGGCFIGFCAGGYFASARCEFEVGNGAMEVSGSRELKFFPGVARGCCYKGFSYESEAGARAVPLKVNSEIFPNLTEKPLFNYYNGGAVFVDAQKYPNVEILASYSDPIDVEDGPDAINAAVVLCEVGKGKVLLSGTHPEFTPDLLKAQADIPGFANVISTLRDSNKTRLEFMKSCLKRMGLNVNESSLSRPSLTPLLMISSQNDGASKLIERLESTIGYSIQNIMDVGTDKFRIHKSLSSFATAQHKEGYEDPDSAIIDLFNCNDVIPDRKLTPYFNLQTFNRNLSELYKAAGYSSNGAFGSTFVYGEVLTSTSVLMDRNAQLLRCLPEGFTIHGTTQVSGKGRSGNVWVNPPGVVAVSTFMKLPINNSQSPIVFIQYLASMAFVEAVSQYGLGYDDIPIRIKWPNDVYLLRPELIGQELPKSPGEPTYAKIGGILVNTNIFNNEYYLVVGSGLNLSNAAPTTSINLFIEEYNKYYASQGKRLDPISAEKLVANYLVIFNSMYNKFKTQGFEPFFDLYYKRWLHQDQIVHIKDKGSFRAKVTGITKDWGMLLAQEVDLRDIPTGNVFELQPDGNSFDMFKGLISRKH
ncbi:hypothetical protein CANARDRAFT_28374 [[Candida] arabinofermentans NRRL YB-2248]|uniref:BPL/LPL catalytic domain-containing protein n=1 Tax=[Candida] arabinofermentans NRRL YB-2248 TaxID=983967 RepID=A0A1E4T1K8_9ASCO|nr:hypothetical protein CANARDRAFT_28374 [[Candida] arabinofermentans NRRL YB-2248]